MVMVMAIAGSPSAPSRSAAILDYACHALETHGIETHTLAVRDLDAQELLHAQADGGSIAPQVQVLQRASGVLVATPVYKAAYTGILKAFLDLLPAGALGGKVVLPIASGSAPTHALMLDYAFKPVLAALGAAHVATGLYLQDSQFSHTAGTALQFHSPETQQAMLDALSQFVRLLQTLG